MPKLSVIIPVYNTEKYLTKCLNSVCNQTLFDIEIICINDCSTDKSFEIVKQFALKDKRIKHLDLKENKGASNARNLGINEAKGEFIAFLDSDDYPERNDFYEKLYLKAKEENSDIIKGCYKNSDTGFIDKAINDKIRLDKNNFCATYTSAIFKSELIKENKIKFPLISDMEDPVFAFSCALNANKISLIDELNLIVTKRPDSLTSRVMSFKQIVDKFEGLKMIVDIANNSKTISSESYNFVVGYWANI